MKAVFQRFLARGKPGYVPHQWAPIEEAVGWITQSGGVATLAHPGRYALSLNEMETLLSEFRDAGGRGIEVITGNHSPDQAIRFTRLAIKYGLAASRGADYHGPGESRVEPGRLPALPPRLQPVWDLL